MGGSSLFHFFCHYLLPQGGIYIMFNILLFPITRTSIQKVIHIFLAHQASTVQYASSNDNFGHMFSFAYAHQGLQFAKPSRDLSTTRDLSITILVEVRAKLYLICVSLTGRRFLKEDAMPSVFAWSTSEPKRQSPRKRQVAKTVSTATTNVPKEVDDSDSVDYMEETEAERKLKELQNEKEKLQNENEELQRSVAELRNTEFTVEKFIDSDSDICFCTGFPNFETLWRCFCYLNPGEHGEDIVYVTSGEGNQYFQVHSPIPMSDQETRKGRKRKLSPLNEFFLVLVWLRLGLFEQDLAHRFGVHASTINRIFFSWINFMYLKFGYLKIWPSREMVDSHAKVF